MLIRAAVVSAALIAGCSARPHAQPFPIDTCHQAAAALQQACGYMNTEGTICWNDDGAEALVGLSTIISEELFSCMRGASDCEQVHGCMRAAGYSTPEE